MIGLPGPPSGEQYRKQELHTQLGLDEQQRALRELERDRTGRLPSLSLADVVLLAALIAAVLLVLGMAQIFL
jgi:hypothetical protein